MLTLRTLAVVTQRGARGRPAGPRAGRRSAVPASCGCGSSVGARMALRSALPLRGGPA